MVDVRPFRALRPPPERAAAVAAVPYDVVDVDQARALAAGNPDSFLHVSRPEIDLAPDVDPYDDAVYGQGALALGDFVARGVLCRDEGRTFSVYRQSIGAATQTGVAAAVTVADYVAGAIATHERTRPDKETDRVRHIDALGAHDEPVFLLHERAAAVDAVVDRVVATAPEVDFTAADGVTHTVWPVRHGADVTALAAAYATVPRLYVADGHHRSAAAARVADPARAGSGQFLAVLFPADELTVLPYHRAVTDLGRPLDDLLAALAGDFAVDAVAGPVQPDRPGVLGLYAGRWWRLTARDGLVDRADPVARLDVSLLQDRLLGPLLGVHDPRTDPRLRFVGGPDAVERLAAMHNRAEVAAAFTLPPTSTDDLVALADAGLLMPPKSTWFEPKLRSGLVVHVMDAAS